MTIYLICQLSVILYFTGLRTPVNGLVHSELEQKIENSVSLSIIWEYILNQMGIQVSW